MISSIAGSMMTLLWSIVMITIMMYMFSLCFLNAVTAFLNDNEEIESEVMIGINQYWSSVPQSMMSLFWAVTGGADWEPLAAPIRDADSFFYTLFFFYITFTTFAVLNVLTGMFVDKAMQVAQQDEENVVEELMNRKEVKHFRETVIARIPETPGFINQAYVEEEEDPITIAFHKALEIEHADGLRVFGMMDPDKKKIVNLEEYIKGCCHAKGSISGLDMVLLMNETKHMSKQLMLAVDYIQDRFDEVLPLVNDGCETQIEPWEVKVLTAEQNASANGKEC